MPKFFLNQVIATSFVVGISGCNYGPTVVPVEGVVTLEGKPLVNASVNFQPVATDSNPAPGSGSFGRTDSQGHYSLELVDPPIAGAVPGEHRVTITRPESQAYTSNDEFTASQGDHWPSRFSDGSLRKVVDSPGTTANFELTLR